MSSINGEILLTMAGRTALAAAHVDNTKLKITSYSQSSQEIGLVSTLTEDDITPWRSHNIDEVEAYNAESIVFKLDCPAEEATDYTRVVGIYLEDGTLYAVAKPSFALPPSVRQVFTPVLSVNGQTEAVEITILETDNSSFDRSLLNTIAVHGNKELISTIGDNGIAIAGIESSFRIGGTFSTTTPAESTESTSSIDDGTF